MKTADPLFDKICTQREQEGADGQTTPPEVADFERDHPDFFPVDTPLEKRIDYVAGLSARRRQEMGEKIEKFHNLDQMTEAANNEREYERQRSQNHEIALGILRSDGLVDYFLEQFRKIHLGDELVMRLILLVSCCQQCENSFGIHPALDGVKGSGKSSAVSAALFLLPAEFTYSGTFSAKALYYAGLKRGTIVFSDDTLPDDDTIGLLKRAMTAFHEPTQHVTVNKDRKTETLEIPPETVFILTSVGTSIDDQLRDRQVVVAIDKSPELDRQYAEFLKYNAATGACPALVTPEVEICREMVRIIKGNRYHVLIPFAERIRFSDEAMGNRRAMGTFFDYIRSSAVLNYLRRQHEEQPGHILVTASEEDFASANALFPRNEYQWNLKLSKREKEVFDLIAKAGQNGIMENQIVATLKMDKGGCHRLLHGDQKRNLAGLVDKAPVTYESEYNKDTGRHSNIWTITKSLKDGLYSFAVLVDIVTTHDQPKKQPSLQAVV